MLIVQKVSFGTDHIVSVLYGVNIARCLGPEMLAGAIVRVVQGRRVDTDFKIDEVRVERHEGKKGLLAAR